MARSPSPLRYPGGKTALLPTVSTILRMNNLDRGHYAEPFAGGGGLALSLLFKGDVGEIHLNDIDPAIGALWRAILHRTDEFVARMIETPVTIAERFRQRELYLAGNLDDVTLGFATLFLNRVNRSGIIRTGGVIGGLSQSGKYLLDCRFNKPEIESRIRRIAKYKRRINFTEMDASNFLGTVCNNLPKRSFVYADPPYYVKGADLYTSSYRNEDHAAFSAVITKSQASWMITYDDVEPIRSLYGRSRKFSFDLNYSAQTKRVGTEILIASDKLKVPISLTDRQLCNSTCLSAAA